MDLKGKVVTIRDNGNAMIISSPMKDRVMFGPHSAPITITYEQLKDILKHFEEEEKTK